MIKNTTGKNSIFRRATLLVVAFSFVQLVSVGTQSLGETIVIMVPGLRLAILGIK